MSQERRFRVFENPASACACVAGELALLIRERALLGRTVALGLPAGRTPLPLYEELIYLHHEERLSFQNVHTFNVGEYFGLPAGHPASIRAYMDRNFFDHVDLPPQNIHFLSGSPDGESPDDRCAAYEREIEDAGGIDYLILGIGRNGHIAHNEPGSSISSRTRCADLADATPHDAAAQSDESADPPARALTLGCGTIMEARKIALLAWSARKSRLIRRALTGPVTSRLPASFLQRHPNACFFLDTPAASLLAAPAPACSVA